jgi:hypothetical protein
MKKSVKNLLYFICVFNYRLGTKKENCVENQRQRKSAHSTEKRESNRTFISLKFSSKNGHERLLSKNPNSAFILPLLIQRIVDFFWHECIYALIIPIVDLYCYSFVRPILHGTGIGYVLERPSRKKKYYCERQLNRNHWVKLAEREKSCIGILYF